MQSCSCTGSDQCSFRPLLLWHTRLEGSVQQRLKGDKSFLVQPQEVIELLESKRTYMGTLSISKELKELCKVNMCAAWALKGGEHVSFQS